MLHGLSGTLWPVHLKPLSDELLSSWLIRFSHAHGYKVQTMCLHLFGHNHSVWNRDLDKLAPEYVKVGMLKATGATEFQFKQSTLQSFEGLITERINPNGMSRWILPVGVFHRNRRRFGLMYCAKCLSEDAIPYFRKEWRLAYATVCIKHNVYLLDACQFCQSTIAPHRADIGCHDSIVERCLMTRCSQCYRYLQDAAQLTASSENIRMQRLFNDVLAKGYTNWDNNPAMYSLVFFDGFRSMIAGLTSSAGLTRLSRSTFISRSFATTWTKQGFEFASFNLRKEMMTVLSYISQDWPNNFVRIIQSANLRYSDLRGDALVLPYWYENVIRSEAFRGSARISYDYADSIVYATKRKFGKFTNKFAREISGLNISSSTRRCRLKTVSENVYADLLNSLDHEIAGISDKKIRLDLIRDKVMFVAGHLLSLGTVGLSELTLEQCRQLVPTIEDVNFYYVPDSAEQARAWIEWFYKKIRPLYCPGELERRVFLSRRTHSALRKSTISLRFNRAVQIANLG